RIPNSFFSKKSQWKKRKTRNMPPPTKRTGADLLIAARTTGSLENVAVSAPTGPRDGADIQTITHGSTPPITKTANRILQTRNQRRPLSDIVERTSALIMALSMLVMVSNRQSPAMIRRMERISMERNYVGAGPVLNLAKPGLWENPGSTQVYGNPLSGPVSPGGRYHAAGKRGNNCRTSQERSAKEFCVFLSGIEISVINAQYTRTVQAKRADSVKITVAVSRARLRCCVTQGLPDKIE